MLLSPLKWMCGKSRQAPEIIRRIPAHRTYVEPFAGGLHVLFQKPPSPLEVVGDLNGNLVNLWMKMKLDGEQLATYLADLPVSDWTFKQFQVLLGYTSDISAQPLPLPAPPGGVYPGDLHRREQDLVYQLEIQRAAAYFFLVRCSYNGIVKKTSTLAGGKALKVTLEDWAQLQDRLRSVIILESDYTRLLSLYDGPDSFFYLDPPYFAAVNGREYYEHTFTDRAHQQLRDRLARLKGKWLLSLDDCEQARELYEGHQVQVLEPGELLVSNYDQEAGPFYIPGGAEKGIPSYCRSGVYPGPAGAIPGRTAPPFFYVTLSGTQSFPRWDWSARNILVSAGGLWNQKRGKFVRRRLPSCRSFFLDSGGFTAMERFGAYPWTVQEYADLVNHYQPALAAVMDYPCEPDVDRSRSDLQTNQQRVEATLKNHQELLACELPPATTILPVIQGYHLEEYVDCIDRMDQRGLLADYMAVGSMCRRVSITELEQLGLAIALAVQERRPGARLHFFGLKLSALKLPALASVIYSCDSAAWSNGTARDGQTRFTNDPQELFNRLVSYEDKITRALEISLRSKQDHQLGIPGQDLPDGDQPVRSLSGYTPPGSAPFTIPNCPHCQSRQVQSFYTRHSRRTGKGKRQRTFRAAGLWCASCKMTFQKPGEIKT